MTVPLAGHSFGCENVIGLLEYPGGEARQVAQHGLVWTPCPKCQWPKFNKHEDTPSLFQNSSSRWSCLLSSWYRHLTYNLYCSIIAFIGQLKNYMTYSILLIKIGHVPTGRSFTHMSIFFFKLKLKSFLMCIGIYLHLCIVPYTPCLRSLEGSVILF